MDPFNVIHETFCYNFRVLLVHIDCFWVISHHFFLHIRFNDNDSWGYYVTTFILSINKERGDCETDPLKVVREEKGYE